MIVISDTSPLNYLVLIGHVDVLPVLFGRVVIPPAVVTELSRADTPEPVRRWIASPPAWLEVRGPVNPDPGVGLGAGENGAIALAIELHSDYLLIDDGEARAVAQSRGIVITGTLGV